MMGKHWEQILQKQVHLQNRADVEPSSSGEGCLEWDQSTPLRMWMTSNSTIISWQRKKYANCIIIVEFLFEVEIREKTAYPKV